MTRFLTTIALLGTLLAAPAWAQTMTPKMHHQRAAHAAHHAASMRAARHRHHFVAGDDHAEMLNRQALDRRHKGG